MEQPLRDDDIEYVCNLVHRRCGVVLRRDQAYLVEARLALAARRSGLPSAADLVDALRRRPEGKLHENVVEEIAPKDTRFFRDEASFRVLRDEFLPDLIARREDERVLRIWSAGCSTGQEPYSIALLLAREYPALRDWDVHILATDFAAAAVERVREARYNQLEVNRGLDRPLLESHFDPRGVYWYLHDDLRGRVQSDRMNLIAECWPPMDPMDIVFLRNVLLYFDEDFRRDVLDRTRAVLRDDGALLLGVTETPVCLPEGTFERIGDGMSAVFRPCEGAR